MVTKNTRETIETKGMIVREKEYGRRTRVEREKNRTTLETSLHRLQE